MDSIHKFKVEGISGEEIDFALFKGKRVLIVNVASECGFTPQYKQLQELYTEFRDDLVIIGFPSNDFGGQEPGTDAEIQTFCSTTYQVTFPLARKIKIKGPLAHPIYQWLTHKRLNGVLDTEVRWNFHKFLLNESGHLVNTFPSAVSPFDDEIMNWVAQ